MNDESTRVVHWSFWVIAVVAFVWNAMGVMNYLMQMSTDSLSTFAESHRAIIEGRPAWATGGFAIGVFGWHARLPAASTQEVGRLLSVRRVAFWRDCDDGAHI